MQIVVNPGTSFLKIPFDFFCFEDRTINKTDFRDFFAWENRNVSPRASPYHTTTRQHTGFCFNATSTQHSWHFCHCCWGFCGVFIAIHCADRMSLDRTGARVFATRGARRVFLFCFLAFVRCALLAGVCRTAMHDVARRRRLVSQCTAIDTGSRRLRRTECRRRLFFFRRQCASTGPTSLVYFISL